MTLDTGSLRCNIHCMTTSSMQSRAGTSHAALTALTSLTALTALIHMSLLLSVGIEMLSLDI